MLTIAIELPDKLYRRGNTAGLSSSVIWGSCLTCLQCPRDVFMNEHPTVSPHCWTSQQWHLLYGRAAANPGLWAARAP